jgi:nitroreductase
MQDRLENFKRTVRANRSYRRFFEDVRVSDETLTDLLELARTTASGQNNQVTRFALVSEPDRCQDLFKLLRWAGALKDWDCPEAGERPSAYIVLVSPKKVNAAWDEGIIAQTILLGASEIGLGGCMLGSIDRLEICNTLKLDPETQWPKLVIALGKPKEEVVIEDVRQDQNLKYYRDEKQVHHVPKIVLEDLIIR